MLDFWRGRDEHLEIGLRLWDFVGVLLFFRGLNHKSLYGSSSRYIPCIGLECLSFEEFLSILEAVERVVIGFQISPNMGVLEDLWV